MQSGTPDSTYADGQTFTSSDPNRPDRAVRNLTVGRYFIGTYLPTILAILLRIVVGMVYSSTKMMEPFYCLAEPDGALAKDFLNINYLSTNDSVDPFLAMFSGHWLMLTVSILYTGVGLLTPFTAEFLTFTKFCNTERLCGPEMRVNPTMGRILQALLAFTAIMLINLWRMQRKQRSGIYSDPSSIAAMTSLLHNPKVVDSFRKIDPGASKKEMETALSDQRFRLGTYTHYDGNERYGLVLVDDVPDAYPNTRGSVYAPITTHDAPIPTAYQLQQRRSHRNFRLVRDIIFGAIMCGALIIIVYYFKVGADSGFERFFSGQGFGPRFVFTIVGVLIHSQWKRVERGVLTVIFFISWVV